jgi:putative DNA primase/helicase
VTDKKLNLSENDLAIILSKLAQGQDELDDGGIVWPIVNGRKKPVCVTENVEQLLKHYGITVKYNEMTKDMEIFVPDLEDKICEDTELNAKFEHIKSLATIHNIPAPERVIGMLTLVAAKNSYHPVRTWLDNVTWDGTDRFGEYYDSVILEDEEPLKETLMRKWALSLVAALYHKNFGAEGVLTFSGKQGIGKTTWIKNLIPQEYRNVWNTESVVITEKQDSKYQALAYWITELGELDATFNKTAIESLKAFITATRDELRRPYARTADRHSRRTVFYATVNETNFLQDDQNRRFWVLSAKGFKQMNIDCEQFWAQVKVLYDSIKDKMDLGFEDKHTSEDWGWYLSPQERLLLQKNQEQFRSLDQIEQMLEVTMSPVSVTETNPSACEWLNATEILQRLGIRSTMPKKDLNTIAKWLRNNDYQERKFGRKFFVQMNVQKDIMEKLSNQPWKKGYER